MALFSERQTLEKDIRGRLCVEPPPPPVTFCRSPIRSLRSPSESAPRSTIGEPLRQSARLIGRNASTGAQKIGETEMVKPSHEWEGQIDLTCSPIPSPFLLPAVPFLREDEL